MANPRRTAPWRWYPEMLDAQGNDTDRLRQYDEFGMELPTYLRSDLVDEEVNDAYQSGMLAGAEDVKRMVAKQYGIDMDRGPEDQPARPRRVLWEIVDDARDTPRKGRRKAKTSPLHRDF